MRAVNHTTLPLTLTLVPFKCTDHERLFSWMLQVLSGHTQGDRMSRSVRYELISVKNDPSGGLTRPGEHFIVPLQHQYNPITPENLFMQN